MTDCFYTTLSRGFVLCALVLLCVSGGYGVHPEVHIRGSRNRASTRRAIEPLNSSTLTKTLFANATARGAVCNDGTPSGYYLSLSPSGSDKWLVYLEGGYWCFNDASCKSRQSALKSSKTWPATQGIGGVFGRQNNAIGDYNQMFIKYCTSDQFSGTNTDTSSNSLGWTFQGKAVLKAALQDLFTDHAKGGVSEVIFGGCSAGGQAVVNNADDVADMVAQMGGSHIVYSAFMDAGWMTSPTPYWKAQRPMLDQMQIAIQLWQGLPDKSCASANADAPWSCYLSPVAAPYITSRYLMHTEQFDAFQLPYNIGSGPPFNHSTLAYAEQWRSMVQEQLVSQVPANQSFWSGACYGHCVTSGDNYFTETISVGEKLTLQNALEQFWQGQVVRAYDQCQGFNCSQGCLAP